MPKDLKLDDIWDTSDDLDIPARRRSMTAISSSSANNGPSAVATTSSSKQPSKRIPSLKLASRLASRQSTTGPLVSPSSPNLSDPISSNSGQEAGSPTRPGLTRSMSLPKNTESKTKTIRVDVEELEIEPVVVEKIRRWILGIAIVEFDVDQGPLVDAVFPLVHLSPQETSNIAFAAFPDSLQFDQGSQNHSFRIHAHAGNAEQSPVSLDGFMYGYSHFIQRRDSKARRGYEQRSVVILSHLPYPALFTSLSSIFGPLFQIHGIPMLESACYNIATWPDPIPGAVLELGFLGSVLHSELPPSHDSQQHTDTSSFGQKYDPKLHILASTPPFVPPPLSLFEASLSHLWSIWECVVLGEPLLIFGSSPVETSQAVWWLRDLLRPIPLFGDIRPYFTIHDQDHAALVNKLPPKAGVLLGVTNPLFYKSCSHWPHVLSLGRNIQHTSNVNGRPIHTLANPGPVPGWRTMTHKRYISKDRVLLKQLEDACRGSEQDKRTNYSFRYPDTLILLYPHHQRSPQISPSG
ncbi:hypothetical protein E1B28_011565 [Marasmius oreades]|uniref:UDENN domain-containing protein n=1 Tax=Marasmius oreades TaxID=181124 RepID=A0A9P7RV47_9AGAR|nr:uncharacterized protein E1B28_011565 [Marasmius oreades]KAG7089935.1 hypothetical protein E1B28_011565 [Marasmius oreades]